MEMLSINPPETWLSIIVAYIVIVLTMLAYSPADKKSVRYVLKYTLKFFLKTALTLAILLSLILFQIISWNTLLWVVGISAFAIIMLIVGADMSIPSGSKMPGYLKLAVSPWALLFVSPFWILSKISIIKRRINRK